MLTSNSRGHRGGGLGHRGFSIIELMVAMALGLLLTGVMINVFIYSKSSIRRQEQLNTLQQGARVAFEYLTSDARMIGHLGCYTGLTDLKSNLGALTLQTNYKVGVEGYDYALTTPGSYTLSSLQPSDETSAAKWSANTAIGSISPVDPALISSGAVTGGLASGSDVLVIRTIGGRAVRLSAATVVGGTQISVESVSGGMCSNGTTAKMSGFCQNSYGLIASCTNARVFKVSSLAGSTLNISGTLDTDPAYPTVSTEVFPVQTVAYYVKRSSAGGTMSLYRRIFDGDNASGLEQELIENVESMQIRYGVDKLLLTDTADGSVNGYVAATSVLDWNDVVAIRMSLLIRAADPIEGDSASLLPTSAAVNGVTVTYPSGAGVRKYDRRVFTTTVAVRNKISYGL